MKVAAESEVKILKRQLREARGYLAELMWPKLELVKQEHGGTK